MLRALDLLHEQAVKDPELEKANRTGVFSQETIRRLKTIEDEYESKKEGFLKALLDCVEQVESENKEVLGN